jgi:hypothetical protein
MLNNWWIAPQIPNPTQVVCTENNIVFNLVEQQQQRTPDEEFTDLLATVTSAASPPPTLAQQREQIQNIKKEAEGEKKQLQENGQMTGIDHPQKLVFWKST